MRNPNTILSKTQLLEHVWDYHYEGFSNIVETYIKYLRRKLKILPQSKELIHTVRGLGLSIAKQIVLAHHGESKVKSMLKKGITKQISFPYLH